MVLFLVYVTTHELNMLIGDGELYRLFFRWRSIRGQAYPPSANSLNRLTEAEPDRGLQRTGLARTC